MNVQQALETIDRLALSHRGRGLNRAETLVIEAAWEDVEYSEVVQKNPDYSLNYLQRHVGPALWRFLSEALGTHEPVSKKRLPQLLADSPMLLNGEILIAGQLPECPNFVGYVSALEELERLAMQLPCIAVTGVKGMGKSALVAQFVRASAANLQGRFNGIIWRSIHYAPTLEDLVADLIAILAPTETALPADLQARISVLIKHLQARQCLLVLDGVEAILEGRGSKSNPYGKRFVDYGIFFRRIIEEVSGACVILTSQEPLADLERLKRSGRPYASIKIDGLQLHEAVKLLKEKGVAGDRRLLGRLAEDCKKNPLALEKAAFRINEYFGGDIEGKLGWRTSFSIVNDFLDGYVHDFLGPEGRLAELEKQVVVYLAQVLEESGVERIELTQFLPWFKDRTGRSTASLITALEVLSDRELVVKQSHTTGEAVLSLPASVKRYLSSPEFVSA